MPVLDGFEMVKKIRQKDELIPILFASGQTDAQNVIAGYELRVDNFIKKPFLPEELNVHIQAILKRTHAFHQVSFSTKTLTIGRYLFDVDTRILRRNDETNKLSHRESQILWHLYQKKGEIVSRDKLLEEFWGINDYFTSRSLDVFIHSLRRYFSKDPDIRIETLRGIGFQFIF
jgi:DNA-binding response OmpR family regulator